MKILEILNEDKPHIKPVAGQSAPEAFKIAQRREKDRLRKQKERAKKKEGNQLTAANNAASPEVKSPVLATIKSSLEKFSNEQLKELRDLAMSRISNAS